jgi:uncharacterized membrane protein YkvA (DUF1232 family)
VTPGGPDPASGSAGRRGKSGAGRETEGLGHDGEGDFYRALRRRVRRWARARNGRSSPWTELVLLAPDLFHLLCRLAGDPEVPRGAKTRLAFALAYFISPVDLLPEALFGPIGYLDDVALTAYVLHGLLDETPPAVLRRHWAGDQDVVVVIRRVLGVAGGVLGAGLWRRLRRRPG